MPDTLPLWDASTACKLISDIYTAAIRDPVLHARLMNNPYEVLSERIQIPPEYQKNFLSKPEGTRGMILTVPKFVGPDASSEEVQAQFTIVCTEPPW